MTDVNWFCIAFLKLILNSTENKLPIIILAIIIVIVSVATVITVKVSGSSLQQL